MHKIGEIRTSDGVQTTKQAGEPTILMAEEKVCEGVLPRKIK